MKKEVERSVKIPKTEAMVSGPHTLLHLTLSRREKEERKGNFPLASFSVPLFVASVVSRTSPLLSGILCAAFRDYIFLALHFLSFSVLGVPSVLGPDGPIMPCSWLTGLLMAHGIEREVDPCCYAATAAEIHERSERERVRKRGHRLHAPIRASNTFRHVAPQTHRNTNNKQIDQSADITTFLNFQLANSAIGNATFRCRNTPKKRETAPDQRRTADVVNEKATIAERRGKRETVAAAEDVVAADAGSGGEQNGDRSCCRASRTLASGEYLLPCPRCSFPCHVDSEKNVGACSRQGCSIEFCISCSSKPHIGPCKTPLLATPTKRNNKRLIAGSRQSKRNLRRL
ncbi:F-box only protein 43 [Acromyrmex echinatior]|uniref:F-box only protein 43 n=1 Tax=Acromyrmex echinatior TaxID=103372 RepID=F4WMT1_ACREC|nr:F-box only protein 43 [Acromyrmex echinatior]